MTALIRAANAERLKLKRTLALWLAIIAPLSIVALQFVVFYDRRAYIAQKEVSGWVLLPSGPIL